MYLMGKKVEDTASGTSTRDLLLGLIPGLKGRAKPTKAAGRPAKRSVPEASRPARGASPAPRASKSAAPARTTPAATESVPAYVPQKGVDSTADPATVLPDPIIPKF
jgi:sulfide:quinone oxidoreductase